MYLYFYDREKEKHKIETAENRVAVGKMSSDTIIKEALSHYNKEKMLGLSDTEIKGLEIMREQRGKPHFKNFAVGTCNATQEIHYSISHSGSWWACIISDKPVGFDIEICNKRQRYIAIAKRFFSEAEYNYVLSHGEEGFFDLWIRKEAYIKYKGTGLSEGLSTFSLVRENKLLNKIKDYDHEEICYIHPVDIGFGIKAAYCAAEDRMVEKVKEIFVEEE